MNTFAKVVYIQGVEIKRAWVDEYCEREVTPEQLAILQRLQAEYMEDVFRELCGAPPRHTQQQRGGQVQLARLPAPVAVESGEMLSRSKGRRPFMSTSAPGAFRLPGLAAGYMP